MTDQTKLLLEEIEELLPGSSERRLREIRDLLRQPEPPEPPSPLVGIGDLDGHIERRFGMIDTYTTEGLWLVLVQVVDDQVEIYDKYGVKRRPESVTRETVGDWRLTADSIAACARARMPGGRGTALREKLSSLTKTEEDFLWDWGVTFISK